MSRAGLARSGRHLILGTILAVAGMLATIALAPGARQAAQAQAERDALIVSSTSPRDVELTRPQPVRAGFTDVTFRNRGPEPVNMALVRLRHGTTLEELRRVTGRTTGVPDRLIAIEASQVVEPGATFETTVRLAPGGYVALGNVPDGRGLGPAVHFEVTGPPSGAPAPEADARIRLYDHGIIAPARIPGGATVRVDNIGKNLHLLAGIRLDRGVSAAKVARDLVRGGGGQSPPPGEFVSVIGLVSPDTGNAVRLRLPPGRYVLACFFADRHSAGRGHNTFGMVKRLVVTR